MSEFIQRLFDSDFMPHGHCYLWRPEIVWLHAISDTLITLSYYFIPFMLVYLVRKRRDLPFHWMFLMFGIFILGCGTTHAVEIWTLWNGTYRLAGVVKAITAAASVATAVALVPMVSKALLLTSPAQLRAANLKLEREIAERRRIEEALQTERNFVEAVLDTVGTLIVVLDLNGRLIQCNSACVLLSGRSARDLLGRHVKDLFMVPEEGNQFQNEIERLLRGYHASTFEGHWSVRNGGVHMIAWTTTVLLDSAGKPRNVIVAGVDITESKRLEKAVLDISAREQRRIGQDLHDGLGQHLTGVAFMSKVLRNKLADRSQAEEADAAKIVELVNAAVDKTRELARGLLPVQSDEFGLMSALEGWADKIQDMFKVTCRFTCSEPVLVSNNDVATHSYRIAQEAVNNALKHGRATEIDIHLQKTMDGIVMIIEDNGVGLPVDFKAGVGKGLGLQIMNYRANMIGAELQIERRATGGTTVTCWLHPGAWAQAADS